MYDPSNWYWVVGGDEKKLWSSFAAKFVGKSDGAYLLWLNVYGAPSRIGTLEELGDVLGSQFLQGAPATPNVVREKRRKLLSLASNAVNTLEDEGKPAGSFRAWRVALREVPEQEGFPDSVEWPAMPEDVPLPDAQVAAISEVLDHP